MYLNYLSQEAKCAFWNLATNLVQDDGGVKEEETKMLISYQQEMISLFFAELLKYWIKGRTADSLRKTGLCKEIYPFA